MISDEREASLWTLEGEKEGRRSPEAELIADGLDGVPGDWSLAQKIASDRLQRDNSSL